MKPKENKFTIVSDGKDIHLMMLPVDNNTNWENTYFINFNGGKSTTLSNRENYDYTQRKSKRVLVISKEPINFYGQEELSLDYCGITTSDTIKNFLDLECIPRINIGDVNPFEHGAILIEHSNSGDWYVQQVDKFEDVKEEDPNKYLIRECIIDDNLVGEDYYDILKEGLMENNTSESYKGSLSDMYLFFNSI